jgi:hypothetical protein
MSSASSWRVAVRRERLASVSWYMRILKQRIARRANAEDGVTGLFCETRFQSVPLLDQAAIVSCMAYVDLNPVRAKMASTPEASEHTGVQQRIVARQNHRKAMALCQRAEHECAATGCTSVDPATLAEAQWRAQQGPEYGIWLAPALSACDNQLRLDDYRKLVDQTGWIIASGKRGAIPAHLAPVLQRLQIDVDAWLDVMRGRSHFLGTAVGALPTLVCEATRRGVVINCVMSSLPVPFSLCQVCLSLLACSMRGSARLIHTTTGQQAQLGAVTIPPCQIGR